MRNAFILSLTLIYFVLTLGMEVSLHYCMGELEEISLNAADPGDCCCNWMKMPEGCCDDKKISLDLDENHQVPGPMAFPVAPALPSRIFGWHMAPILAPGAQEPYPCGPDPPPRRQGREIRLLHHSLTYYG